MTNPADYLDRVTTISRDGIHFGEEKLPGCIVEGGVTLKPGGAKDVNVLTVDFYVGPVAVDDAAIEATEVTTPAATITQFGTRRPQPTDDSKTAGQGV